MKWITREHARVDRVACPWLISRFIDKHAEFFFVPNDRVLEVAGREKAHSFDADGAEFTHRDGKCTFEIIVEHFKLTDPTVHRLARIVHGADVPKDIAVAPEAAGLRAIAEGIALIIPDDQRKLGVLFPVYDALYAYCQSVS